MGLRPSRKKTQHNNGDDNVANNSEASSASITEATEDSSSNNNSSKGNTLQREAWTARAKLLLNFHNAISRAINSPEMKQKCAEVASFMSSETAEEGSINHDYDDEATLIVQNKHKRDTDVRDRALAVGFCTFALLRGVPLMRNAIVKRVSTARKYKFESTTSPSTSSSSQTVSHELQQQQNAQTNQPSRLRKFLRLALDATISTAMTFLSGTFLFTPRPSAYIEDMSKLPLVAGKSVYAEVVCPPLLNEYKRTMEEFGGRWPVMTRSSTSSSLSSSGAAGVAATGNKTPTLTQEDVSLNIIRKFAENCSKRIKYEHALQDEQNALTMSDKDGNNVVQTKKKKKKLGTIFLPTGVPEDVTVNIDEDIFFLDYDADTTEEAAD
jgi:hypothetical protein